MRYKIHFFLTIMILIFLNSACATTYEKMVRKDEGEKGSFFLFLSKQRMKRGGKGSGVNQGKCIYGCIDPAPVVSTASASTTPVSITIPSTVPVSSSIISRETQDYILGPEDVIDVSVWKNENLSRTVLIRPDGKISLPLIGDVQAAGLTTSQLRDSIKTRLKEYKETPEVSIIVKEINSFVVFVTGEVIHPGKLLLKSDTSLLQAISLAGGFTQYASKNSIVLLRRVGGIETRKIIRYKDIVSGRTLEGDPLLQRGDTIVVP